MLAKLSVLCSLLGSTFILSLDCAFGLAVGVGADFGGALGVDLIAGALLSDPVDGGCCAGLVEGMLLLGPGTGFGESALRGILDDWEYDCGACFALSIMTLGCSLGS